MEDVFECFRTSGEFFVSPAGLGEIVHRRVVEQLFRVPVAHAAGPVSLGKFRLLRLFGEQLVQCEDGAPFGIFGIYHRSRIGHGDHLHVAMLEELIPGTGFPEDLFHTGHGMDRD